MSSSLPKISIITPSFNQGKYIQSTLDSVLSQGYPNLEYIIMDGGSTDETLDILKRYEGRIIWTSEPDRGQSHAINKGLRLATGEIVAFLNSDDLYLPGALMSAGQFFAAHPQADWLTGKCRIIDERGVEVRRAITMYKNFWLMVNSYSMLLVTNYISQPATFWKKSLIEQAGYIDENLTFTMDLEYWLRLGQKARLFVLNQYLASFRTHLESKTRSATQLGSDEEWNLVRRYTRSPFWLTLHRWHHGLMNTVYRHSAGPELPSNDSHPTK